MGNSLKPGDRLKHFVIKKLIGSGGMGDVWLAHDESLSRDVAIKTLQIDPDEYMENFDNVKRFLSEAKVLAQLQDPSITTIFYISKLEEKFPFIVMEYLEGQSLKEYYLTNPVNLDLILDVLIQVSKGLEIAHRKGIIHRDIKPANLFKTESGYIKILDFGIAKWLDDPGGAKTNTNQFVGSLIYTPPEVFKSSGVSDKIDIYSLGITAMTMITGEQPFNGETTYNVLDQIQNVQARFPEPIKKKLPEKLVDLIYQMVEKDPRDRPESMQEVYQIANQIKSGTNSINVASFNIKDDSNVIDIDTSELNKALYAKEKTKSANKKDLPRKKKLKTKKVVRKKESGLKVSVVAACFVLIALIGGVAKFLKNQAINEIEVTQKVYMPDESQVDEAVEEQNKEIETSSVNIKTIQEAINYANENNKYILKVSLEKIQDRINKGRQDGTSYEFAEKVQIPRILKAINENDFEEAQKLSTNANLVFKRMDKNYDESTNNADRSTSSDDRRNRFIQKLRERRRNGR